MMIKQISTNCNAYSLYNNKLKEEQENHDETINKKNKNKKSFKITRRLHSVLFLCYLFLLFARRYPIHQTELCHHKIVKKYCAHRVMYKQKHMQN